MPPPDQLEVHFNLDRMAGEFVAHGAYGGPTPHGKVMMALYTERPAIPKVMNVELRPDSEAGGLLPVEISREGKTGFVRTVSSVYYFDLDIAEATGRWLIQQVEIVKEQMAAALAASEGGQ